MAGMEQLEVHSKSYLVRWVNVAAGHTISWSIQPHKKSINFGLFKHPGAANTIASHSTSSATIDAPSTPALEVPTTRGRGLSASRNDKTFVLEKLSAIGLKQVQWVGKCEAEKVSMGTYDVPEGEGGMYGLVIDNTFSKTVSKTATFVLMTYPTNAAPKSGHHAHYNQALAGASTSSLGKASPGMGPMAADSSESLSHTLNDRPKSSYVTSSAAPSIHSSFLTGVLQKKRRKRNQGYARRFFSLDFTSSTLSYYRNDHSSALRGAIPLSLAAVGANEETREISVDSGAEVWQLRAISIKDFHMWRDALDRASRNAGAAASPTARIPSNQPRSASHAVNAAEESEWARVEGLVGRVAGIRDAVRRLAQDTDPKYASGVTGLGLKGVQDSLSPSPSEAESADYFPPGEEKDKKSFWKRKASTSGGQSPSSVFRRSVSAQTAVASPGAIPPVPPLPNGVGALAIPKRNNRLSTVAQTQEEALHDHCMELLRDLDSVVKGFSEVLVESRQRRTPALPSPRQSIDSYESADEFFDAVDGDTTKSQLLTIRRDSGESRERDDVSEGGSESSSEHEGGGFFDPRRSLDVQPSLFPTKPTSLKPLPHSPVQRRSTIAPSNGPPPSLISFLRKNVGKDLSTIAMPVTFNEPISALQRVAEQLEYSELLDAAVTAPSETGERLVYLAAFAISSFSNMRVKDRAMRKPYTPLLGETFELVREDKGFRFIAEKVIHRPLRMACHAESQNWTFIQSPAPIQKFWGKSYEINTDGRVRIFLHDAGEHYSWNIATSFMRNVMAGEKYVEPTGTMTILSETTGAKAVCTFKAGGMFAGRSEEVTVQVFDNTGSPLPAGAQGKWTTELHLTTNGQASSGKPIWTTGALVDKPATRYGFTSFAASLNQITPIEEAHLPPTDSRLRPDQRAAEQGDMDGAEGFKAKLEERQRARRKVMEEHGQEWTPRWFKRVDASELGGGEEEIWRLKGGKEGYWECRDRGDWEGVVDVLEA